jgi:hypothetical protein
MGSAVGAGVQQPLDNLHRRAGVTTEVGAGCLPAAGLVVEAYGGQIMLVDLEAGHSTTDLVAEIVRRFGGPSADISGN